MTAGHTATGWGRSRAVDVLTAAALAIVSWVGTDLAVGRAGRVRLDLGPNDASFLSGFREDWERDGRTTFRWTTHLAEVRLPLGFRGRGLSLRLRARRQFPDPARIRLRLAGQAVGEFEISARQKDAYLVRDFALPPIEVRPPLVLTIEAHTENPRPLGIALDWLELTRERTMGAFRLPLRTTCAITLAALVAFLVPRLTGAGRILAVAHAGMLSLAAGWGAARDPLALVQIAEQGTLTYVAVATALLLGLSWRRAAPALRIGSARVAGVLVLIVLVALAIRLSLLLHPSFYYPDVKVHALLAWRLTKDGLSRFFEEFIRLQYQYSLGLQNQSGHTYAFPYPPAFYFLCWPLIGLLHLPALTAVKLVPAVANSLMVLMVFAISVRLGGGPGRSLTAAACVPLLPVYLSRLTLALYPAMVGHTVDAMVILFVLAHLPQTHRLWVVVVTAALLAMAFLTYTQSLLSFGILIPVFFAIGLAIDRTNRTRYFGLLVASVLGAILAAAVFYCRYIPMFQGMQRGIAVPEEEVLVDKTEHDRADLTSEPEPPDPFAGPQFDPLRGVAKAASRLWLFYGPFAILAIAGIARLAYEPADRTIRGFVLAWAATYVLLNLASGGLPSPNIFRHNKDVEMVAPLCCAGLAVVADWLWKRGAVCRSLAIVSAAGYVAFGAWRTLAHLAERTLIGS